MKREALPETCLAFLLFVICLAGLIMQGCGNSHGPEGQVGAYGVIYPGTAANQSQLRQWLDEVLVKDVELVGEHLGPGAYWPRAATVYWHRDSNSLHAAKAGRSIAYQGWAGWIDEQAGELHVVAGPKGVPSPFGALGHLLEHWHRTDYMHATYGWPSWDRDYAAWDAAFFYAR